jgi:PAS domain S-box-containing protein
MNCFPTGSPGSTNKKNEFANIVFGSLHDLPEEACRERSLMQEIGIEAMVALPLRGTANPIGWIGFSFVKTQQTFTQINIRLFSLIGDAIARALLHQHKISVSKEQEIFLSTVLNTVSDAVFVLDRAGKIISLNRAATQLTGYATEQLLEKKVTDLFKPVTGPTGKGKPSGLVLMNRPDGKKQWATITYNNLVGTNQQITGKVCTIHDVTEETKGRELLEQSELKYRSVIESMELGLLEISDRGIITDAMPAFCNLTGFTASELKGLSLTRLNTALADLLALDQKQGFQGKVMAREVALTTKSGQKIWTLVSQTAFHDPTTSKQSYLQMFHDITRVRALQEALYEARENADRSREAEKRFLANMSHEIRNPIHAVVGLTNLLLDTELAPQQLEYLKAIKTATDLLTNLVSGVLDLSKVEAKNHQLEEVPVDLVGLFRSIIQVYKFRAFGKNMDVRFQVACDLPEKVLADPKALNQILMNLLDNAFKFTQQGHISLTVQVLHESDDALNLQMDVADTGIGIPAEKFESIFESFQQADRQIALQYGGIGLGLAIVKQLVLKYQGNIHVKSEMGKGTVFTFNLILKKYTSQTQAKDTRSSPGPTLAGIRKVLVVDDNEINQRFLAGLFNTWKIDYDLASDGQEALLQLERKVYDLVLMDIRMPVMDGYEATLRLREDRQNPNQQVPIIALTASALVDEREKALAVGMNYHLPKPFSAQQLAEVMESFGLKQPQQQASNQFGFSEALDASYLNELYGQDLERAAAMFEIFGLVIGDEIKILQNLLSKQDFAGFKKAAHKIKPNFSMVGLTSYTKVMDTCENHDFAKEGTRKVEKLLGEFLTDFVEKNKIVAHELVRIRNYMASRT